MMRSTGNAHRLLFVCLLLIGAGPPLSATTFAQRPRERSITVPHSRTPRVAQTPDQETPDAPAVAEPTLQAPPAEAPSLNGSVTGPLDTGDFAYEYDYDTHCGLNCTRCGGVGCDLMWLRAEYLMYWADGMQTPPLATTSPNGTALANAGVLGEATTSILYGGEGILQDMRSGVRFTGGMWLDCCRETGIEAEYFFLPEISERFQASGFGDPIIMRPFFNALDNIQDAEIVSFPDQLGGTITIDSVSEIQGGGVRLLHKIYQSSHCGVDGCGHQSCGMSRTRFNLIAGYRYIGLSEQLAINEDLVSLDTAAPGSFDVNDIFDTDNDFHGGELGLQWMLSRNCWELNLLAKVALGNTHQDVRIRGFTVITPEGQPSTTEQGGLLAQPTNIGDYSRDEFGVVSEFGATLKYRATPGMTLTTGYTLILWDRVARPGDQIDLRVNPNLLPPAQVQPGDPLLPEFAFRDADFWLQGLRLGVECRW